MQHSVLERFRRSLSARREGVLAWLSDKSPAHERCLAGCPEEEISIIGELDAVIKCTETGEFGQCVRCDGEVEIELLRSDFTTRICLDCYSEGELRALERDLELAARVQQQLFPRFVPAVEGVDIAAHIRPARFVGGDYYDFFPFADDKQGAVVADVMGKGLAASMLMSNLQASIRILGPSFSDPAEMMGRINELFRYNVSMTRFISIFIAKIDSEGGRLEYASAGHNPAVLWQANDGCTELLGPTGPAVGLIHAPRYQTRAVRFAAGDIVVIYTDGVSETRSESGEEFGLERIESVIQENSGALAVGLVDQLRNQLDAHSGGVTHDDTTLLAIRRNPVLETDDRGTTTGLTADAARRPSIVDGGVLR